MKFCLFKFKNTENFIPVYSIIILIHSKGQHHYNDNVFALGVVLVVVPSFIEI